MKKITLILFSTLFISLASASHPDNKNISISGVEYSCHPADRPQYCPKLVYDVPTGVMISIDQLNCLNSIDKANPSLKEEIQKCFLGPRLKSFFDDLQLYDVSVSCLKENLKDCSRFEFNCNPAPCGNLANFISTLKERGLTGFEKADGEAACNSLIR